MVTVAHEANRILDFLAGMPSGNATATRRVLREILSSTGGSMFARGELFEIVSKHLGAGVYRLTLKKS